MLTIKVQGVKTNSIQNWMSCCSDCWQSDGVPVWGDGEENREDGLGHV